MTKIFYVVFTVLIFCAVANAQYNWYEINTSLQPYEYKNIVDGHIADELGKSCPNIKVKLKRVFLGIYCGNSDVKLPYMTNKYIDENINLKAEEVTSDTTGNFKLNWSINIPLSVWQRYKTELECIGYFEIYDPQGKYEKKIIPYSQPYSFYTKEIHHNLFQLAKSSEGYLLLDQAKNLSVILPAICKPTGQESEINLAQIWQKAKDAYDTKKGAVANMENFFPIWFKSFGWVRGMYDRNLKVDVIYNDLTILLFKDAYDAFGNHLSFEKWKNLNVKKVVDSWKKNVRVTFIFTIQPGPRMVLNQKNLTLLISNDKGVEYKLSGINEMMPLGSEKKTVKMGDDYKETTFNIMYVEASIPVNKIFITKDTKNINLMLSHSTERDVNANWEKTVTWKF